MSILEHILEFRNCRMRTVKMLMVSLESLLCCPDSSSVCSSGDWTKFSPSTTGSSHRKSHFQFNIEMLSRWKQTLKVAFTFQWMLLDANLLQICWWWNKQTCGVNCQRWNHPTCFFSTVFPSLWKLWNRQRSRLDAPFTDLCCHQSRLLTLQ